MNFDKVIEELRREFCKYESIRKALLFGSRARGDFHERSDYDIAIFGDLLAEEKWELQFFCKERLHTLHKVDLIFMSEPHCENFIKSILSEGIHIYEKV